MRIIKRYISLILLAIITLQFTYSFPVMAASCFVSNETNPPTAVYRIYDEINYEIKVGNPSTSSAVYLSVYNKYPNGQIEELTSDGQLVLDPKNVETSNYPIKTYTRKYKIMPDDVKDNYVTNTVYVNGWDSNGDLIYFDVSKPSVIIPKDTGGNNPSNNPSSHSRTTEIPDTITPEPDTVDKKDGGVTPPPSESVTPPKVKITPEKVPAGDPTITLKSIEELKAAYAILPEGRRLNLKYDSKTGVWKNAFLVPFGTADGPYSIKIFTINRQNITHQYYYTITIDNSLPLIILNPIKNNGKLELKAQVLFPAAKVTAKLGNNNFALAKEHNTDKWFGTWQIPDELTAGSYEVTVTAVDNEGNSGKATFVLEVEKKVKAKESTAVKSVAEVKAPELRVEATEVEKESSGLPFTWGIPLAGVLTVGLLKRRRK